MLSALIVAAGSSQRMGFDKLFAPLAGAPVITHSLAAFEACPFVDEMVVVCRADLLAEMRATFGQGFTKLRAFVPGGARRQDSVRAGLEATGANAEFVAVHDAARPLITPAQIEAVFAAAREHHAAAAATPLADTLQRADSAGFVQEAIARENVFALQTPQIARRALLRRAYEHVSAHALEVTDETSALAAIGQKTKIVPTRGENFKITYPEDLSVAEFILTRPAR